MDEFHLVAKTVRIAFLEDQIQKIKKGAILCQSKAVLKDVLANYEQELAQLKQ